MLQIEAVYPAGLRQGGINLNLGDVVYGNRVLLSLSMVGLQLYRGRHLQFQPCGGVVENAQHRPNQQNADDCNDIDRHSDFTPEGGEIDSASFADTFGNGDALVVGVIIEQTVFPCGVLGRGRPAVGIPQFLQSAVPPQTGQIRQGQTSEKEIDPDRDIKQRIGREKQPDTHSGTEQADGAQPAQIPLYDVLHFGQLGGILRQRDAQ